MLCGSGGVEAAAAEVATNERSPKRKRERDRERERGKREILEGEERQNVSLVW